MLTKSGHLAVMTAFISMFCVFVTAPHSCGALFFLCQGRCPFTPRGLFAFPTFCESHGPAGRLMTPFYARGADLSKGMVRQRTYHT